MKEKNNKALKEWATIVEALGEGAQTLLIRQKGRFIVKTEKGFKTAHNEFFLYPTYNFSKARQAKEKFQSKFQDLFERALSSKPIKNIINIKYYAQVVEILEIDDLDQVHKLSDYYIWTASHVEDYYKNSRENKLYALILKIYKLKEIKKLHSSKLKGAMTYVNLPIDIYTKNCTPVLEEKDFDDAVRNIKEILGIYIPKQAEAKEIERYHEVIKDMIKEIGEMLLMYAEKEFFNGTNRYDVIWKENPALLRACKVFEVQDKGNLISALVKLKHAWDQWRSDLFLIVTGEKDINKARELITPYISGSFHEINNTLVLRPEDIEDLYDTIKKYQYIVNKMLKK